MEQRIDPTIKPAYAAGTDPAYIPGLTAPATAVSPDADERETEEQPDEQTEERTPVEDVVPVVDEAAPPAEDAVTDAEIPADEGDADGPVFEVSDRRGSIAADRRGVRFRLDDQEADFHWDEIGAVEVKSPRFGRRFTVTVHTAARRWFNAEVEAPARRDLKTWAEELDEVLDAYFEES